MLGRMRTQCVRMGDAFEGEMREILKSSSLMLKPMMTLMNQRQIVQVWAQPIMVDRDDFWEL
jgi:hypothetical protein